MPIFLVIMAGVSAIKRLLYNPEKAEEPWRRSLFAARSNYNCRNVLNIDEGVEIFRASQKGKGDDVVVHLRDFAAHFLSRSQMQLDSFAGAALEDTGGGRIRLQTDFNLELANCNRTRR